MFTLSRKQKQTETPIVYELTVRGFEDCMNENPELGQVSRGLMLDYLQDGWKVKGDKQREALQDVIDFTGFKITLSQDKETGKWTYVHNFLGTELGIKAARIALYNQFIKELKNIKVDLSDGWQQEASEIANIILKYQGFLKDL